jgi:arabinofuranosyltransferase
MHRPGLIPLLYGLFVVAFFMSAWIVDDAYITLRVVDNFVHGEGLTWNVDERVQVYTHPLWMLLLTPLYFVTREGFFTLLLLSLGLGIVLLEHARRLVAGDIHKLALFVVLLVGSKSFMDFSSSGLENPLSHLLLAIFLGRLLFLGERRPRELAILFGVASLAAVNRHDTFLLYLPALGYLTVIGWRELRWGIVRPIALGLSPLVVWSLFALVYYGFMLPNTYYAKVSSLPPAEMWSQGIVYHLHALEVDPLTLLVLGVAVVLAIASRRTAYLAAAAGLVLYDLYILRMGAAGTHMAGRFFSTPYVGACVMLLGLGLSRQATFGLAGLAALFTVVLPTAPLKAGTGAYRIPEAPNAVLDTRAVAASEGSALSSFHRSRKLPATHPWFKAGEDLRRSDRRVHVGGPAGKGLYAMGFFGYAAGRGKHIIDPVGLTDPLIARLPPADPGHWIPGHVRRDVPKGYVESVEQKQNRLEDPELRPFLDDLWLITRAPTFSGARWSAIIRFQLGGRSSPERPAARRAGP